MPTSLRERARSFGPTRILETAAGTGVVTQALAAALPEAEIVATDLNPPMLEIAARRVKSGKVRFEACRRARAAVRRRQLRPRGLPVRSDVLPRPRGGTREAHRVLRDGGRYLLAIWDRIERNPLTEVVQQVLVESFPDDPPLFMREGPFSYHDASRIESDLHDAGFDTVEIETVEKRSRCPSAHDAASALCYGTPMGLEIADRGPGSLERVFEAVEQAFRRFEGPAASMRRCRRTS